MKSFLSKALAVSLLVLLATGCATTQPAFDYTAFKESRPSSILVLPPLNQSPDVLATDSVFSQVTLPLAEAGYYVFPVTLVHETFRQNGLSHPADIHEVELSKLKDIFGADAALYITIGQYGTTYAVIASESRVSAGARLVDLRTGDVLWQGSATASSAEGRNTSGGLVGMLVSAVVHQIIESSTNRAHPIAGITSNRLLAAGRPDGILYGPKSPRYLTD